MAKRNIMDKFSLSAIAAVDRPCQEGAKAVIMKRAVDAPVLYLAKAAGAADLPPAVEAYLKREFTQDQRDADAKSGAAMPDGSFPIKNRDDLENAIRAHGRAKDPAKAKSHIIARARALDASSLLPADWKAGKSIGGDLVMEIARVAPRTLPELLDNVVKAEQIGDDIAKISDAKLRKDTLAKMATANVALVASSWAVLDSASGEDAASLLQKNFAEYKDHIAGLAPRAEQGDEIMLKAIAKSLGLPETATEAEIQKALDAQAVLLKRADAVLKMSGKHAAFMNNDKAKMPEGGKEGFMDMSADERDKHMEKNPIQKAAKSEDDEDEDEDDSDGAQKNCIKVDGTKVLRKAVGDVTFAVIKSQQAAIEKAETATAIGVIEKRVAPLKFVIGKSEETAGILHRVAVGKSTKADADAIEKVLVSANALMAKSDVITKELGGNGGGYSFSKAIDGINAAADVLMKADPKLTAAKARTLARTQNPELAKQEERESAEARRAA